MLSWDVRLGATRKNTRSTVCAGPPGRCACMSMNNRTSPVLDEDFLQDVLARALERGATDAQVRAEDSRALTVDVRNGALQNVQNAESTGLQLTAYVGKRKATVGTNDFSGHALAELIERVTS